jgi:hypothetical protein
MSDHVIRPLVLVRGFGGNDVSDEQRNAYQGFNEGTVYPTRRGENFIYEGFVLRALKSDRYRYSDATNVVGYYRRDVEPPDDQADWDSWDPADLRGSVALDPWTARTVLRDAAPGTIWVYRFYDLTPRTMTTYGQNLVRLIDLIGKAVRRQGATFAGVDIVAHSMGGLVVREALKAIGSRKKALSQVHRVVTLGSPHRGIAFAGTPRFLLDTLPGFSKGSDEFASFDPSRTDFLGIKKWYEPTRVLTVVGTNYRTYNIGAVSTLNRLASALEEGTLATNRSDGLVKQSAAQLPGSPRTFVHKCHGGHDSLVTSREAYEIAMRFFHGSHHVRLWLDTARVTRGRDLFGKSEFWFGASIKPRGVDFELFHQSAEAENCYGPFNDEGLQGDGSYVEPELRKSFRDEGRTTGWLSADRLIWEGWIDEANVPDPANPEMVFRLDLYLGERDSHGIGFSDNVVFRKQYYVQVVLGDELAIFVHTGEQLLRRRNRPTPADVAEEADADEQAGKDLRDRRVVRATRTDDGWTFPVQGTGFEATLRVGITPVDLDG